MSKVELKIPLYLLLEGESLHSKRSATLSIDDRNNNGALDLESDQVSLNGHDLSPQQQKEVFARLGIGRPSQLHLGFAQQYFGRVSSVAALVSKGKFLTAANVSTALLPELAPNEKPETWYRRAQVYGINKPFKATRKVIAAANSIQDRRTQLHKKVFELRKLYQADNPSYWRQSKQLREKMLRYDMKRGLDDLFTLDHQAYENPALRIHIPAATEKYLAQIGKIEMKDPKVTMASRRKQWAEEFDRL